MIKSIEEIINDEPYFDNNLRKCDECQSSNFSINKSHYWVCNECGLEYEVLITPTQYIRTFNQQEINEREQTEVVSSKYGARTIINPYDSNINPNLKKQFYILSRIQNSTFFPLERLLRKVKPKIKSTVFYFGLNKTIYKNSLNFFSLIAKKKLLQGRSIEGFIAASIYVASKYEKRILTIDTITNYLQINKKKFNSYLKIIITKILPDFNLKYKIIPVKEIISQLGNKLNLEKKIINESINLIKKVPSIEFSGKTPNSFSAAAIYVALEKTKNKKSQEELAKIAGITPCTLRKRIKRIKKLME